MTSAFWRLLVERRCSVGAIDDTRWSTRRFLHPRKSEPGKAYTFAAGVLDFGGSATFWPVRRILENLWARLAAP